MYKVRQSISQRACHPTHDEEALLKKHERLAHKIAHKYRSRGDYEDVLIAARLGILEAIRTYNPELSSFTTHAWNRAVFAVSHYTRTNQMTVMRIPQRIWNSRDDFEAPEALPKEVPFDESNCGKASYGDFTDALATRVSVRSALAKLSEVERRVIECVILHQHTQEETERILGITRGQVYGALKRGAERLRYLLYDLEDIYAI